MVAHKVENSSDQEHQLTGFCIDLLEELSQRLHFSYKIHLARDNRYGKQDNGTKEWDGIVGEIISGVREILPTISSHILS